MLHGSRIFVAVALVAVLTDCAGPQMSRRKGSVSPGDTATARRMPVQDCHTWLAPQPFVLLFLAATDVTMLMLNSS
jgi:hypothetical protein